MFPRDCSYLINTINALEERLNETNGMARYPLINKLEYYRYLLYVSR